MKQRILVAVLVTGFGLLAKGQSLGKLFNNPLRGPYDSAQLAYKNGDFQKAIALYTEVISKADSTSNFEANIRKNAFIYRSICKKELKDFNAAVLDMNQAIVIDSTDLASYIDRGTIFMEMGELQKAKEDFLKIIETNKKSEQAKGAFYYLGLISYKESKTDTGIEYLTKALRIDPDDIDILFTRACYFGLLMDSDSAIKDYDKLIKLDPSYKEAYANRGTEKINLYNRKGQKNDKLLSSACNDLKKAKALGDDAVDDLLFIHCK